VALAGQLLPQPTPLRQRPEEWARRVTVLREWVSAAQRHSPGEVDSALLTFNQAVAQEAMLGGDVARVEAALQNVEPDGHTALIDAAYAAITVANADLGRGLIILFSDGLDTASWLGERAVIDAARRSDVVVYAVSTASRSTSFLRNVTGDTAGRLYEVSSTRDLRRTFLAALAEFRQRYLVSYTPRGVEKTGWHRVDVRLKGRRATIRARPGYLAGS
jgi:VWFA-related protein